jgi:hypothetical protein
LLIDNRLKEVAVLIQARGRSLNDNSKERKSLRKER